MIALSAVQPSIPTRILSAIFTGRYEVVAKVIFLHLSVILFTGEVCLSACWDTTHPPGRRTSPAKETPQEGGTPLEGEPPGRRPPGKETPLPRRPPWKETPQGGPQDGGTPHEGDPPRRRHPFQGETPPSLQAHTQGGN